MRWSWPFARRPNLPATSGDSPVPAEARDAGPRPTGAWTSLPPIQRTVGDARLTAPAAPFLRAVPGTRQLPQFLQPLGHEASAMAPAGLVVARSRPRGGPAPGPLVESPAVQRQGDGRVPGTTQLSGQPAPASAAQQAAHDVVAARTEQPTPGPAQPARQLSVVPAATVAIPNVSLTRWDVAPARSRLVRSAADATGAAAVAPGGMRRARSGEGGDGRVVNRRPSGTEDALRSASPPGDAALQRLPGAAGQDAPASVRRAGLGAPLAPGAPGALPVTAHDPRGAAARAAAVQRSVGSPVVAAPADSPIRSPGSSRADDGPPDRRLPVLSVARTADRTGPGSSSATAAQRPAPLALAVQTAPEVRPTLGRRPLRPIARVQRAASDEQAGSDEVASGSQSGQPWPGASERAAVAAPQWDAGPGNSSGVALTQAGWHSDTAAIAEGSGPAVVQRRAPQSQPARPSMPAGHATVQRVSRASHPLVRPSVPVDASFPAAAAEPRSIEGARPSVQTAASQPASGPVLAPTVTQVVQRVDGAAPVAEERPGRPSDRDLDELARALFGRIRGQLRSELIHEREAKGLTLDNV